MSTASSFSTASVVAAELENALSVEVGAAIDMVTDHSGGDSGPMPEKPGSSNSGHRIGRLIQRFGSFSGLIRMVGVAALVLSMCLFLIDGLEIINDTQRFMTMLMLTGLLSAGGFVLAFILKEQRGARAFFGLALLSVPVNFTVLGALFYSVFQFDTLNAAYPTVAEWQITSLASLGSTVLVAMAALVAVTVLGVSVMAREGRGWLGSALLFSSSLLMLPIRDTAWIAPLVTILIIALISIVKRYGERTISLKTTGGRFVQALLFLPPAIMLFRSFWLYEVGALSGIMIALTAFAALKYFSQRLNTNGLVSGVLHVLSAATALLAALLCVFVVTPVFNNSLVALVSCGVFGVLMLELESRIENHDLAEFMGIASSVIVGIAVLYHQLLFSGFAVFLAGTVVLAGLLVAGSIQQNREKLVIGGMAFLAVILLNAPNLIQYFVSTGWLGFASLGAIAIVLASLVDRFGPMVTVHLRRRIAVSSAEG